MVFYDDSGPRIRRPVRRGSCAACGHNGTGNDPLVKAADGARIHRSHTTDPRSSFYVQAQKG